jgi:hypothetical protein
VWRYVGVGGGSPLGFVEPLKKRLAGYPRNRPTETPTARSRRRAAASANRRRHTAEPSAQWHTREQPPRHHDRPHRPTSGAPPGPATTGKRITHLPTPEPQAARRRPRPDQARPPTPSTAPPERTPPPAAQRAAQKAPDAAGGAAAPTAPPPPKPTTTAPPPDKQPTNQAQAQQHLRQKDSAEQSAKPAQPAVYGGSAGKPHRSQPRLTALELRRLKVAGGAVVGAGVPYYPSPPPPPPGGAKRPPKVGANRAKMEKLRAGFHWQTPPTS